MPNLASIEAIYFTNTVMDVFQVGAEASDAMYSFVEQKLFVGDREGVKKEKMSKIKNQGKDFVYLERVKEKAVDKSEPKPGTSKQANDEARELNTDSEDEEDSDLQQAIALSLAEEEASKKVNDNSDLEDDDEIVLLEPKAAHGSSRVGGAGLPVVKVEVPDAPDMRESSSSSDEDDFVEVQVDTKAEMDPEEDIFADVFSSKENYDALDDILKGSDPKADHGKKRKSSEAVQAVEPKKPKTSEDKNSSLDIAESMKKEKHLFLQIASRWAADEAKDSEPEKSKAETVSTTHDSSLDELNKQLLEENDALVKEMRETEKRERLMRSQKLAPLPKANPTPAKTKTMPGSTQSQESKPRDSEESALLADIGVEAKEKDSYAAQVLENEGLQGKDDDDVIYGAAAPGFVRSSRYDVVEVGADAGDGNHGLSEEESAFRQTEIARKLSDAVEGNEGDLLSREELAKIQVRNMTHFSFLFLNH